MVDTGLAERIYNIGREAFAEWDIPPWDELTDEKKAVWEEHAANYESEVTDATDD